MTNFTRQLKWIGSSPLDTTWEGCSWGCQRLSPGSYKHSTSPWDHGPSGARVLK